MRYRPSPDFIIALVIIALVATAALYLIGGILFYQAAKADTHSVCDTCVTDYRPDISHCFKPDETRELWDCIRHEEIEDVD